MSRRKKLLLKLVDDPRNFSWDDFVALMGHLGYRKAKSGKTSGSRRRYVHASYAPISLHEPHPQNTLKQYQIEVVIEALRKEGIL